MINNRVKKHKSSLCANCSQKVKGNFCSNCGQSVKDMHQPFWRIIVAFIGEALSFDGKFYHTLKLLLLRPWVLTQDFMKGKRVCYTPPFRMYLFATFFAFLLLSFYLSPNETNIINTEDTIKTDTSATGNHFETAMKKATLFANREPELFADTILKKASQALFVLLPLFALLLALFYYKQKRYFLEHLLLSLNFHTFLFMIVIAYIIISSITFRHFQTYTVYILLLIPIQMFRTLKNYYNQSNKTTTIKFIFLFALYGVLLFGIFVLTFGLVLYNFW